MADLPNQLVNWLYNVLQPQYIHKQVVYTHVIQFLQQNFQKGFRIRTRVYTSGATGNSNLLINIYGNIQLSTGVKVPIELWIPFNYPFSDDMLNEDENGIPIIFVVPNNAAGIYLNPSNFVDSQGKFYHPFLTDWYKYCVATDLNSIKQFNLLNAINLLTNLFEKNCPINISTPTSTPQLPPKPSKIPINPSNTSTDQNQSSMIASQLTGSTISPQTTGPPLPTKPNPASIPLKYQAPLPLPNEMPSLPLQQQQRTQGPISPQLSYSQPPQATANHSVRSPFRGYPTSNQVYPDSPSPPAYYSSPSSAQSPNFSRQQIVSHSRNQSINENLMDLDDRLTNARGTEKQERLVKLSTEINKCLQEIPENSSMLETINTNTLKIDGLYNQLNHHYNQALANKDNLNNHLNHLTEQLAQITSLNQQLDRLQQENESDISHVHYGYNNKVSLDELIIPDLVLTNQLYDIVSDIKANKDLISLIGGDFNNEPEIINNTNFDPCVKAVRNIGRELFWLELLKAEISKKMSIT